MRGQLHALRLETSGFQLPQRRGVPAFFTPCYSVPDHAGPWRRAAAKPQDGCGTAAGPKFSSFNSRFCFYPLCFADSASSRQIHPLPFGLPPFGLKGRRFNGQAKRLLYSGQTWTSYAGCPSPRGHGWTVTLTMVKTPDETIPHHAGPWRRAAAKPQDGSASQRRVLRSR